MQTVINNLKRYENIIIEHNPYISQMKDTVSIVKEFIRKRNLLLYGGTAIDYALRLKGDCIYPDESLEVPDLDFYSPNHVEDAYDLTDILYQLGYKETNAFRAFYVLAMRVDVGGNNIVADIGYIQPDIFEVLCSQSDSPVLELIEIREIDFRELLLKISLCCEFFRDRSLTSIFPK